MVKAELYDNTKTYIRGDGSLANSAVMLRDHPAVAVTLHVVITDESGICMLAIDPLVRRRSQLGIDSSLSDEEAVLEIERLENEAMNAPHEVFITPEERIAAALEFQNIMSMPDVL